MMNKRIKQSTADAADWFAAQCEGRLDRAARERFLDWLRESPTHVEEYLEVARLWQEMGEVDALRDVDIESMLAEAQTVVTDLGCVPAPHASIDSSGSASQTRLKFWSSVAAGLSLLAIAAWWVYTLGVPLDDTLTTAIGEQRSVTLEDGSVISLNTQTAIKIRFEPGERRAELLRGEALFDIARDEQRPFVVTAGTAEVKVLGTTFNVYRQDNQAATVTVLEGRVAVMKNDMSRRMTVSKPANATGGPGSVAVQDSVSAVELTYGEQARISSGSAVVELADVDVRKTVAWTDRRLIFEDATLESVLAEFNRYNTHEIRTSDPTLAALRLNGVFESHDPDSLLRYLERAHGVRVLDDGKQRILESQ